MSTTSSSIASIVIAGAVAVGALAVCKRYRRNRPHRHSLKLTYFNFRSSGEPIRLALVIAEIPFEDERLPGNPEGYAEVARRRNLGLNGSSGTVPVLSIDGLPHSQSNGLLRFVGRLYGKGCGSTPGWVGYPRCECGQLACDEVSEAVAEIQNRLLPAYYGAASPRSLRTGLPCVPLSEEQRRELLEALNTDVLPSKFALLEALLLRAGSTLRQEGDGGTTETRGAGGSSERGGAWFLGKRLSICDLSCYVLVSELLDGTGPPGITPAVLDGCPNLRAHAAAISRLPAVLAFNERHGYSPSWI